MANQDVQKMGTLIAEADHQWTHAQCHSCPWPPKWFKDRAVFCAAQDQMIQVGGVLGYQAPLFPENSEDGTLTQGLPGDEALQQACRKLTKTWHKASLAGPGNSVPQGLLRHGSPTHCCPTAHRKVFVKVMVSNPKSQLQAAVCAWPRRSSNVYA